MKQEKIKIEDWMELYKTFDEFKQLACWEWMLDSDLFGVKNPEDGVIGYCCIMGKLGRYKAIAIYQGTEGLESYLRICNGESKSEVFNPALHQKCLMASLESSSQLEREDFELIEQLNLTFNTDEFPVFRNHTPGYLPWFLEYNDIKFLTEAIKQAIEVSKRCKNNKKLLQSKNKTEFLVRVKDNNGWHDEYLKPDPLYKKEIKPIIEQNSFDGISKFKISKQSVWEIGLLPVITPVREFKERPYYPYIIVIVDRKKQKPIGFEICEKNKINIRLPALLINTLKENEYLPERIICIQKELFILIKYIMKTLKVRVVLNKKLKTLEPMVDSLISIVMSEQKMM